MQTQTQTQTKHRHTRSELMTITYRLINKGTAVTPHTTKVYRGRRSIVSFFLTSVLYGRRVDIIYCIISGIKLAVPFNGRLGGPLNRCSSLEREHRTPDRLDRGRLNTPTSLPRLLLSAVDCMLMTLNRYGTVSGSFYVGCQELKLSRSIYQNTAILASIDVNSLKSKPGS
jgi:hypothetical protein